MDRAQEVRGEEDGLPGVQVKYRPAVKAKIKKVMHEFKFGTLHSGSKKGPRVSNRKQAIAIALNQARKV